MSHDTQKDTLANKHTKRHTFDTPADRQCVCVAHKKLPISIFRDRQVTKSDILVCTYFASSLSNRERQRLWQNRDAA